MERAVRLTDKTAYPLSGVVPIIHTPWTEDDYIDFPSLERLIERSIEDGISGCIMPAVASEVAKLSDEERTSFVEEVIRTWWTGGSTSRLASATPT